MQLEHFPERADTPRPHAAPSPRRHRPAAGGDEVVELERQARGAACTPPWSNSASIASSVPNAREVPPVALFGVASRPPARVELLRRVLVDAQVHAEERLVDVVAAAARRAPSVRSRLLSASAWTTSIAGGASRPGRKVEHRLGSLEREAAVEDRALGEGVLLPRRRAAPTTSRSRRAAWPGAPPRRARRRADVKRSRMRSTSCAGDSTRTRAAASSIASGRPSSRRTTSATAARLASPSDEVRPLRAGAGGEELDRILVQRQRLDREDLFARQVQALAAGDDEGRVRRAVEPAAERGRRRAARPARSCRG